MRPRVFPAEDELQLQLDSQIRAASMRPRVFPAEDQAAGRAVGAVSLASMRPRYSPRKTRAAARASCWPAAGFNEAAGIPRGRLVWEGTTRYGQSWLQ